MKLSKKSDYALRALLTLAEHYGQEPISIRELARRNDVPKRFLEHIMLELKGNGWVRSAPGRDGGYVLATAPDALTIGQVVRHFDGVLAPIGCVSASHHEACSQEHACRFRRVFLEIRNFTARFMDRTTLAAVQRGEPLTQEEPVARHLNGGAGI
jgi:Rrf2 family protein